MRSFEIEEGDVWAENFFSRQWSGLSGITLENNFQWRFRLDMSGCPDGTTIKLCGASVASPFRFERVKKDGLGQILSFTHEDSDRIIATKTSDEISLQTYVYRNGSGPSTDGSNDSKRIVSVENREPFSVGMDLEDDKTRYSISKKSGTWSRVHERSVDLPFLKHKTFAHAKGYKQPSAPGLIKIEVLSHV